MTEVSPEESEFEQVSLSFLSSYSIGFHEELMKYLLLKLLFSELMLVVTRKT